MNPRSHFRQLWRGRRRRALISVHRGLWGPAPENSLAAITAAERMGIVEIDIQLAGDGVPVVFHDDTLNRMTGEDGLIADFGHRELTGLRLLMGAGGPDAEISSEYLPTLAEVLKNARRGSWYDFDVKHPEEVEAVAGLLKKSGGRRLGSLKVDTETPGDIDRLLDLQERSGVMVMAKVNLPRAGVGHIADLASKGVAAAEVFFGSLDELAQACRLAGEDMAVSTYTLDPVHCCGLSDTLASISPDKVWGQIMDAGVSVLMTDRAMELDRYLFEPDPAKIGSGEI